MAGGARCLREALFRGLTVLSRRLSNASPAGQSQLVLSASLVQCQIASCPPGADSWQKDVDACCAQVLTNDRPSHPQIEFVTGTKKGTTTNATATTTTTASTAVAGTAAPLPASPAASARAFPPYLREQGRGALGLGWVPAPRLPSASWGCGLPFLLPGLRPLAWVRPDFSLASSPDAQKRKSKWDSAIPVTTIAQPTILTTTATLPAVVTVTTSASGSKTTVISAVGTIVKKAKQ